MTPIFITGLVLSALIGLSLGLIGGGGSILTVPILVYFLSVDPHSAVAMSLAVVGATSLFGTILHYWKNNVDMKGGLIFGVAGIVGAFVGSPLTKLISSTTLLLSFGLLMIVVALVMLLRKGGDNEKEDNAASPVKALMAGFGVGILTGFLGVGGGFLIVPGLVFFSGLPMKRAIGTSLLVIFLNCVAGLVAHMSDGGFEWQLTGMVTVLALAGAVAGTLLSHGLPAKNLQKAFAVLVLIVGGFLLIKNHSVIF